ncbi:MAG TPA: YggS family pyridoxal phosphate-dependent enzyme [Burkholderiales bacterium]|jgi:pyridoxal phosphate enzyme (YggS family)|nr:YggS family pyridoxal phosphate-dependent enzyme [Burkholderiales bacterium]
MTTIAARLQAVRSRIEQAAEQAGRDPGEVCLVAVSKGFPADAIREAFDAGQRAFGENYAQEALDKMASLRGLPIEWHYIGPIQSNKTRAIAAGFTWVHSVDRFKIAQRLSDARPRAQPALNVCIQVNVSGESSKSGVAPGEALALARQAACLPGLRLRGLMAIPEPTQDMRLQRVRFAELRRLKESICASGLALDTLSMGMTEDLEAAILEGATLVRVGRGIFGERPKRA